MSARQRARIVAKNALAVSDNECYSSESSQEEVPSRVVTTRTFQFDSSEASETEPDTASEEEIRRVKDVNQLSAEKDVVLKNPSSPIPARKVESYDELEYLESVIGENAAIVKKRDTSIESLLFHIEDIKVLDVSVVLRRRQGQQAMIGGGVEPAGRRGNIRNRGLGRGPAVSLNAKKVLFGAPSEDWPRPSAFVAGGLGMSRVKAEPDAEGGGPNDNTFSFEWSPEFRFLHAQYQYIQSTGDANILVMFLAHFPHHPQALMELSRVYAGLGQADKSADLVRRALYVLECACMEAFKPSTLGLGLGFGLRKRLDSGKQENAVYFEVLQRHMQICSVQGCHGVAMEICRYMLSLHPVDTNMLLLMLDHYLVMANRHDLMLAYCGLTHGSNDSTPTNITPSNAACTALTFNFVSPYRFSSQSITTAGINTTTSREASLQDMPNWWFSLALSAFLAERRGSGPHFSNPNANPISSTNTSTDQANVSTGYINASDRALPNATTMLKAALLRWPFVLRPLLSKMGIDVGGAGVVALISGTSPAAQWRKVLTHGIFAEAASRVPSSLRGYLDKVAEVYSSRNAPLWAKEETSKWLLQSCTELMAEIGENNSGNTTFSAYLQSQNDHYSRLVSVCAQDMHLLKYQQARVSDYNDAVPRIPDDLNPLDPSLDDVPYVLSGAVRFRDFMDAEGRFLFPVPEPYVTTVKTRTAGRGRAGNGENGARPQRMNIPNIDLNLPLMQLFLATIFPWIYVPPAVRR